MWQPAADAAAGPISTGLEEEIHYAASRPAQGSNQSARMIEASSAFGLFIYFMASGPQDSG